jgi:RimJ/RimL family protein N-acetyltransferase
VPGAAQATSGPDNSRAIVSDRLSLRPLTVEEAENTIAGLPCDHWSPGYPTGSDVEIAQLWLAQAPHSTDAVAYGPRQILERVTGCVIGGIGFFGPPDARGRVRFGYGLVPERRHDGVATEATLALLAAAWTDPRVLVALADTTVDNLASQRVLSKAGLQCVSRAGETLFYEIPRPPG